MSRCLRIKINREELLKQFGSINPLSIETEEQGYTVPSPGAESSPPARPLLDVPRFITDISNTGYDYLSNVSCLSDEEIWTSGDNEIMKLYNMKGELLKSIQTKSGNMPADIAVTRSGDTDTDHTIGGKPDGLCSTSSGDLLVIVTSDDEE
uniref:Uncharacterized protein LOC111129573 n=1 Tax=Crassostrea virginica TaxID=6565 RepID=A0A8B8DXL5_CRAVI|nr:uncharacterized protein LOC111129573 [Crassostrea virginica]